MFDSQFESRSINRCPLFSPQDSIPIALSFSFCPSLSPSLILSFSPYLSPSHSLPLSFSLSTSLSFSLSFLLSHSLSLSLSFSLPSSLPSLSLSFPHAQNIISFQILRLVHMKCFFSVLLFVNEVTRIGHPR